MKDIKVPVTTTADDILFLFSVNLADNSHEMSRTENSHEMSRADNSHEMSSLIFFFPEKQ